MGEAKRRALMEKAAGKAAETGLTWADFLKTLSSEEVIVANVANATYTRLVVPGKAMGMCYRLAYFMSAYLQKVHQISAEAVIGYGHDETGPVMMSHAWLEFNSRKTDVSLAFTEHPEAQPRGQVIILDHVVKRGHQYRYYREQSKASIEAINELRGHPEYGRLIRHKEWEHSKMLENGKDLNTILTYLNSAPDGMTYDVMAKIISR